jgi:hypothetical protein
MADFTTLVNSLVGTANRITASLQATVGHEAYSGTLTRDGQPNFATSVSRTAIVEKKQHQVRAQDGTIRLSETRLVFLVPLTVDVRDRFTLPDGMKPAILSLGGPLGSDGKAFVTEIYF